MDKKKKKELKNEYQMKQKLSQEEWEEQMLENDSYYDVEMLEKANKKAKKDVEYWEGYQPSSWLGKWWRQTQIDKNKKKIKGYKND